jgi:pyruvate dehydrogenase (quinone)
MAPSRTSIVPKNIRTLGSITEAAAIRGNRLENADDVEPGLRDAFSHDGSVLVDAVVNRQTLVIPPRITAEMTTGFTFYKRPP